MKRDKLIITGGAGFIGSEFVRQLVKRGHRPIVVDKLTYAGDLARLGEVKGKYKFYKADICNKVQMALIFKKERPQIVVNFAAQTHVDRSIVNSAPFVETNIKGVQVLMDVSRRYKVKRFVHISTDEVYGEIKKGRFTENSPLKPNSPYAASKAAADLFLKSYIRTYGFPAIIIRPCNNYGSWQYPEKLIPVIIYKALNNQKIPIYARGLNVRQWLYVSDCAAGILKIMKTGKIGQVYNLGSQVQKRNIDIAKDILKILGKPRSLIQYVKDRPGHDFRYCLNSSLIRKLSWQEKTDFKAGLCRTVDWYSQNSGWLRLKVRYLKNYWKKIYQK
jgi:dTDP-glucose 4,6-dehydratase